MASIYVPQLKHANRAAVACRMQCRLGQYRNPRSLPSRLFLRPPMSFPIAGFTVHRCCARCGFSRPRPDSRSPKSSRLQGTAPVPHWLRLADRDGASGTAPTRTGYCSSAGPLAGAISSTGVTVRACRSTRNCRRSGTPHGLRAMRGRNRKSVGRPTCCWTVSCFCSR
jgi:hypothetical protein